MKYSSILLGSIGIAIVLPVFSAHSALTTYTPDAETLHLWHLDEADATPLRTTGIRR